MGKFPNNTFSTMDKERLKQAQAAGGLACKNNPKNIMAGRLNWMKRTNNWDDTELEWFKERMENPQASAFHIETTLERYKNDIPRDKYLAMMATIHKLKFGDKITIDQKIINVNVELSEDRRTELLEKFKELQ